MDQERPRSLRSVASNSTISSGISLSRRPRTRKRSKTVTGSSSCPDEAPLDILPVQSDLPYLSGSTAQESNENSALGLSGLAELPLRPPKSPQRLQGAVELLTRSDATSSQGRLATNVTVVSEPPPLVTNPSAKPKAKPTKATSLPHLDIGYRPAPSAFSRDPALTPIINVRDSVSTQQSGASSSLYPPSTATVSRVDSPATPASILHDFESIRQSAPMNPEVPEVREYDSDDVAYRLRLLVNNSYFLPPAHAKPSPAEFAPGPDPSKKAAKSPSPTFFDLFRVGKSKSKPTTPTTAMGLDHPAPMLRTTSDSITASFIPRTQQSRPSGQVPINAPGGPPRGRVVVVREKMEDIMVAAKQAEQDLKAKSAARMDQESQKSKEAVEDAIDPTDAVDIPLPSPTYPFAVQASALHGLGVQDSVGADVLADRLPPNISHSYDPMEDRWRKALLQEAVHHSLDNSADSSFSSNVLGALTPKGSFRKPSTESLPPPIKVTAAPMLAQKIIDQPTIDMIESSPSNEKRPGSAASQSVTKADAKSRLTVLTINNASRGSSRPGSILPQRAETPQGPMTSLGPAPRRIYAITKASLSQTDLTVAHEQRSLHSLSDLDSRRGLRRIRSSPQLVEGYDSSASRFDTNIPPVPPVFRNSQATTINTIRASYQTIIASPTEWERQDSFIEMAQPRPSFATSRSEYSQQSASPVHSVFQELVNQPDQFGSESHQSLRIGSSRFSFEQRSALRTSPSLRYSNMSPPPRMSSSLAHVALPPPPRSSSLAFQGPPRNQIPIFVPSDSSDSHPQSLEAATLQIVAPEPTTPPLPDQQRRREERLFHHQRSQSSRAAPSPSTTAVVAVQSTPGPPSATSFFDTIQTHPNAMDDLESSSDEDDRAPVIATPPKPLNDPRARAASTVTLSSPRPPIMRHGSFSTPYLRAGASSSQQSLPAGHTVLKMPVENVPLRPSRHEPPSSFDFYRYAQEHPPTTSILASGGGPRRPPSRPATTDDLKSPPKTNPSAQESLKKLDGMLVRHMEDERDTIKRIALNLKQTAQS